MTPDVAAIAALAEREAVVRWLRDPVTVMALCSEFVVRRNNGQPTAGTQHNRGVAFLFLMDAADAISRGAHLLEDTSHG